MSVSCPTADIAHLVWNERSRQLRRLNRPLQDEPSKLKSLSYSFLIFKIDIRIDCTT
jgi:hypothetical protein